MNQQQYDELFYVTCGVSWKDLWYPSLLKKCYQKGPMHFLELYDSPTPSPTLQNVFSEYSV